MIQQRLGLLFAAALLVAGPLAFVACGDDEETPCETNDDCSGSEACVDGVCKATCTDADDCPSGQCATNCPDSEINFCFDPCTSDDDCSDGKTCQEFCGGRFKECRDSGIITCEEDTDCDAGQICDEDSQICIQGCRKDEDCEEGEVCNQEALGCELACEEDDHCEEGEVCVDGHCVEPDNTCEEHADCSERPAYCEASDDGAGFCVDMTCGSAQNDCDACEDGPNGGKGAENGPVIFGQEVTCVTDSVACPDAGTYKCSFTFQAFDPNDDLPTTDLGDHIKRVAGSTPQSWGLKFDNGTYTFVGGCYGDNNTATKHSTIYLTNRSGLASNTLCF